MQDSAPTRSRDTARAKSLGVKIEAEYTVGEYDIVILSAKQSDGLETWLRESGYSIPEGASKVLGSYIKQDMHFFVAKVNLDEKDRLGFELLRPLQMAFETKKFMLPIRLGMLNASGPQELFVYTLTSKGRVETTNYRTTKIPTDIDVPLYVRDEFPDFYRAMFDEQVRKDGMRTVHLEHAWDMGWCDPCAADPLSAEQLRSLGVFWNGGSQRPQPRPLPGMPPVQSPPQRVENVFVTRLHVRYDAEHFPEDLVFQETGNRENFQGRYVLHHAWEGDTGQCDAADGYFKNLTKQHEQRAKNLASLTAWPITKIREQMKLSGEPPKSVKWWDRLWKAD